MFDRILIANRGEIACRVIRTARRMGIGTVAVFSEADRHALHVEMADMALPIGGPAPADSYLRGEAIITAARESGAGAIHPGYGFLSENPDFVEAVADAGLTFIGPSAEAIRAMGLKDAAKALMEKAGVPVVPGYHGADQNDEHLAGAAETIGYPVLIKAIAGGGGKGMRLVEAPGDFGAHLASARAEARTAFGNDAVLVEKFVEKPRHIEVQIFGDGTDAVHLFERDCSLQRRHQKVIEEAPAPGMTDEMRAAMGQAAVRAAKAIAYRGAGTVEFIVDASDGLRPDRFWFMEMNTRLQVEHPVTEAITGVDLVEWQLRVAAGERLPCAQSDLDIRGHAFEARLYAEDVPAGFLPATGQLAHLRFPSEARADSGVRAGDVISPHYDPMIAKLITHGDTREQALGRLRRALGDTEVAGTVTNLDFLARLARHKGFSAGDVDTGLIGRDLAALSESPPPESWITALAVIASAGLHDTAPDWAGFSLWAPLSQTVVLVHEGREIDARLQTFWPGRFVITLDGGNVEVARLGAGWSVDGTRRQARLWRDATRVAVFAGRTFRFESPDPLARGMDAGQSGDLIAAPMPGLLKAITVAPGDRVDAGVPLAVLEAMKMEHALPAPRDGVIAELLAAEGAQVDTGTPLIRLEEEEE